MSTNQSSLAQDLTPESDERTAQLDENRLVPISTETLLLEQGRGSDVETKWEEPKPQPTHQPEESNAIDLPLRNLVVFPPVLQPPRSRFRVLQKWEGYVVDIYEETFLARLVPIEGEGSEQEAEIFIEEVGEDDRALIVPGAVFYWSIGYLDRPSGRQSTSLIRFQRMPAWTASEIKAAEKNLSQLKQLFQKNVKDKDAE